MRSAVDRDNRDNQIIFEQQLCNIRAKVDNFLSFFLGFQWLAGLLCFFLDIYSFKISLNAQTRHGFPFVLIVAGVLTLASAGLTLSRPGSRTTRYTLSIAQSLFSISIVYLNSWSVESLCFVLVSLSIITFYFDYGVLWISVAMIGLAHVLWTLNLALLSTSLAVGVVPWREMGLGGWLVFAGILLSFGVYQIRDELWAAAQFKMKLVEAKEEALRRSSSKSTFVSSLSHEIRTPLGIIIGFSEILSETDMTEDQRQYVQTIHRCSESLLILLNDVLDLSKIESGLLQVDRHRFDVYEFHRGIQSMFAARCQQKNLVFEVHLDNQIPKAVVADSHRIRQVLINLIGNAIKFTERGSISIHVTKDSATKGHYCWSVKDTGVGISNENQQKLFQPFSQAHSAIAREHGGSGLGLMISKNLIELMGGTVSISSQVGEGSIVSFSIPLDVLE